MRTNFVVLLGSLLGSLLLTSQAGAVTVGTTAWSMNGASCTPTSATAQGTTYSDSAGTVGWNGADTGTITVYCPIRDTQSGSFDDDCGTTLKLYMTYQDTDGSGTAATAKAQLIELNSTTGSLSTIGNAALSTSGTSSTSGQTVSVSTQDACNFQDDGYYYVRVDLVRTGSTWVNLIGVRLGT